jgi:ubiquinone/menaquinone biosynthesis C-methylase UbiE
LRRNGSVLGAFAPTDQEVGAHYEDAGRAEGLARLYDASTPRGEFYRDRLRRIASLLEGARGDLLDAGCGTGQMLRFLRETRRESFRLTGLDRSEEMVEVARRVLGDAEDIRLVTGRLEQMPFETASFDVVMAMGSLEYVTGIEQALDEIARVTRPGGLAILTMQNPRSPYRIWESSIWARVRRRRGQVDSPIVSRLAKRDMRRRLAEAGLAPQSVVPYGFSVLVPPFDSRFPRAALRLQRSAERFASSPLRWLATDYIVVARRAGGAA